MKKLVRTQYDRKLAGVCGGLAKYLGIDSTIVRIIFIVLFFLSVGFPLLLAYFIAIFLIPNEEDVR
ncbi:PspC domain-containing protein [Alkalihalophilus marmarensis]|jgi:phage shock protein C|uniref:PspC domain-containing protein n=1 Tax=Alkalihalophilus marmarensis TaxID=521377 RepID=UPI0020403090|nr:PspC domain-containing protein [Alkalihalophilus marmarensis]MCM3491722.1 PspC domain-containing protein [Alkalihalophilus marmarensis]